MRSLNKSKSLLNLIDQTMEDADYIAEERRYDGLTSILVQWFKIYSILAIFQMVISPLAYYMGWHSEKHWWYFPFYRWTTILLSVFLAFLWFKLIKKTKVDLRQREFIRFFSIPIGLLILNKLIYPVSYYINVEMFINLSRGFPLELIFAAVGIWMIMYYTRVKELNVPFIECIACIVFYLIWEAIFQNFFVGKIFFHRIDDAIAYVMQSGVLISLCYFKVASILKKSMKHE